MNIPKGFESYYRQVLGNNAFVEVKPLEVLPPGMQIVLKGTFFMPAQGKVGEDGHGH